MPVGLLSAGLIGPLLTELYSWRDALLIIATASMLFVVALNFTRAEFDSDKDVTRKFHFSDLKGTVLSVLRTNELRGLAFGCFAFVGLQFTFTAYFVIYLTEIGYSLIEAGTIFSVATAVAIPGRILWGWLSSSYVKPRVMLGLLALLMFVANGFTSAFNPDWATWQITLVAAAISATVFSWHGVTLAEVGETGTTIKARGRYRGCIMFWPMWRAHSAVTILAIAELDRQLRDWLSCLCATSSFSRHGFPVCGETPVRQQRC